MFSATANQLRSIRPTFISRPLAFSVGSFAMREDNLAKYAERVLTTCDPLEKVKLTNEAVDVWAKSRYASSSGITLPRYPARPSEPRIIPAGEMPSAKECGLPNNIYYLHGLAHVELNAIDLCFDTMVRFARENESDEWWDDWISIASDEARHFKWLDSRLRALGSRYGVLPAHGLIWLGADQSRNCRRERIALGQLVAEARGLDAGPKLASRLTGVGDKDSADIVRIIADEEIRHVQIGVKYFIRECEQASLDPITHFHSIALKAGNFGAFAPPFNHERRAQAGLTPEFYVPVAEVMQQIREQRRKER